MKLRSVFEVLIAGACLALLAVSASAQSEASRSWRIGTLIGVVAIYLISMWARNRFWPANERHLESSQAIPNQRFDEDAGTIRKYLNAWNLIVASIALIGFSLMIVMRIDGTETHATRLIFWIDAWGVLVVTAALLMANPPRRVAERFAHWWLPGILLLLIAYVAIDRMPDLVKTIAGSPDANQPSSARLLLVPIAVFVWRSIRILRSTSDKR